MEHRTLAELEARVDAFRAAPAGGGRIEWIVRRPGAGEREVLEVAELDPEVGLRGDDWSRRASRGTPDGSPSPDAQLTLVNARVIAAIAGPEERWSLAGDQLFVDMELGPSNLPVGTRLSVGEAVVEVTSKAHLGCPKFRARFGADALTFVRSPAGRDLRARGMYARVVTPGAVRRGDFVTKLVE